MSDSIYDKRPQLHPVLKELQDRFFPFSHEMYPEDFAQHYHFLRVRCSAGVKTVHITRYQSGWQNDLNSEKLRLVKHVKAWYGNALPANLKDWLATTRPTAVFAGHGLPEEIALVCEEAMKTGYVPEAQIGQWAWQWIGLDCNGFVCFYYLKLGTFSRVLHKHPQYPLVTKVAKSVPEIEYDSCVLWAKMKTGSETRWQVKSNPAESGAHIAVVDSWHQYGSSLWVVERGGVNRFKGHVGIHTGIYDILEVPKAGAPDDAAIWKVRSRDALHDGQGTQSEQVFITRRMQSY